MPCLLFGSSVCNLPVVHYCLDETQKVCFIMLAFRQEPSVISYSPNLIRMIKTDQYNLCILILILSHTIFCSKIIFIGTKCIHIFTFLCKKNTFFSM